MTMFRRRTRWREVVHSATWLYDGSLPVPAHIVRQNFDPYYEEAYDPDPPVVNEEGESYSLVFGEADDHGLFASERPPFLTLEAAQQRAEDSFGLRDWTPITPPRRIEATAS